MHIITEFSYKLTGHIPLAVPLIGNAMTYERKVLTMQSIMSQTLSFLRLTWRENLKILILGVVLPQFALNLYFDLNDQGPVGALRELGEALGRRRDTMSFRDLLAPAMDYASQLGIAVFVVLLWTLVAYFALVHLCVHAAQTGGTLNVGSAWARGVKTVMPKGFLLLLGTLFFAGLLGQIAVAPVIFFLVLASMIPVIVAVEHRGALWSFRSALSMSYIRSSAYSGWNVFFTLMTVFAFLYTLVAIAAYGGSQLMVLDEVLEIPRDFWLQTFPGRSFGPLYLGLLAFETLVTSMAFCFAAAMTVAVYFAVFTKRDLGQV